LKKQYLKYDAIYGERIHNNQVIVLTFGMVLVCIYGGNTQSTTDTRISNTVPWLVSVYILARTFFWYKYCNRFVSTPDRPKRVIAIAETA
jgi:hypothetical protein